VAAWSVDSPLDASGAGFGTLGSQRGVFRKGVAIPIFAKRCFAVLFSKRGELPLSSGVLSESAYRLGGVLRVVK